MINFRYHLVSLVAVFLALAIGIVAGSTVIKESILDSTQKNLNRAEKNLSDLEATNNRLSAELNDLNSRVKALGDGGTMQLLQGRLIDTPVLVLQADGVDGESTTQLRAALADAGATVAGVVVLSGRLALTTPDDINRLRQAIDSSALDPNQLRAALVHQLSALTLDVAELHQGGALASEVLNGGTVPTTTVPEVAAGRSATVRSGARASTRAKGVVATPTASLVASRQLRLLLDSLRTSGLVNVTLPDGADNQDLAGLRLLVISGAGAKLDNSLVVNPLLQQLSAASVPVAVAAEATKQGATVARGSFVGPIRGDSHLRDRISTVDDAEWFAGWAAVVIALADLGTGRVGQYGLGAGADHLLPPPPP
jgi:hypothetical protein